jgi:hypothetical protein
MNLTPEKIADCIKEAGGTIRNRFLLISALFVIIYGLLHLRMDPHRGEDRNIMSDITFLERMRDTSDVISFIKNNEFNIVMSVGSIPAGNLVYKLNHNPIDKSPIIEAIEQKYNLYEEKIEKTTQPLEQAFNLLGVNIRITWFLFLFPFVIMLLFHDLTRNIFYRRKVLSVSNIPDNEQLLLGVGVIGLSFPSQEKGFLKLIPIIDKILFPILLIVPLICSISLLKFISYYTSSFWLLAFEFLFTCIIAIELIAIFYKENILQFGRFIQIIFQKSK